MKIMTTEEVTEQIRIAIVKETASFDAISKEFVIYEASVLEAAKEIHRQFIQPQHN